MRIICPHCDTSYAVERTGIKPEAGVQFTIVCTVCGNDFDGLIHQQVEIPSSVTIVRGSPAFYQTIPGVPASRLNRWTFGLFGVAEVPAYREMTHAAVADIAIEHEGVPAALLVSVRKRD